MQTTSSRPSDAGLVVFESGQHCELPTPMSVSGADANADEVVLMLMVRPSNRLSKMVASIIGVLVVTTQYKTSECETRDKEHICSIER
jgi:hypothetical protein